MASEKQLRIALRDLHSACDTLMGDTDPDDPGDPLLVAMGRAAQLFDGDEAPPSKDGAPHGDWDPLTEIVDGDRYGPHGPVPSQPERPSVEEIAEGIVESKPLDLGSLLAAPKPGAAWGDYDFDKPSLAVIAVGARCGIGIVLHTVGGHVRMEMEEVGIYLTEDLGIHPPEPGVWVWEGKGYWSPGNWEHPDEGDMDLRGKFRRPTDAEWQAIRMGECPWDDAMWKGGAAEKAVAASFAAFVSHAVEVLRDELVTHYAYTTDPDTRAKIESLRAAIRILDGARE